MLKAVEGTTNLNHLWTAFFTELRNQLQSLRGPSLWLFLGWLITMVSLPIAKAVWGQAALNIGVSVSVALQAGLVLNVLYSAWGWRRSSLMAFTIITLTWLIEAIGTHTGYPFGVYVYTSQLQPQLGHVPLLIPLAWLMMLPVAWAVASYIVDAVERVRFALISALAFTAWDLFLDPQMVAWGFWIWDESGGYFGIPWLNFVGWFTSAFAITWLVSPYKVPTRPLLLIYVIIWLLESFGLALFWQLLGPALVGFVGMGIFVGLVYLRNQSTIR